MKDYLPFPGEQALLPPGRLEGTHFYYFVLPAEQTRLEALCDRYLNRPSNGQCRYEPLGCVLLGFSHVEALVSGDPSRGSIRYKDIAFWVPLVNGKTRPFCLFPPLIFVDDASTLVTGREIYGIPKQLGRFEMPLSPRDIAGKKPPQFRAEVVGTLQPERPNDWRTLLTLEQTRPISPCGDSQMLSALAKLVGPKLGAGFKIPNWLSEPFGVPCVGLKQFRDARQPLQACYQAVIEAPLRLEALKRPPQFYLDAFKLTLMDVPSHPVAETLGLASGESSVPLTIFFEGTMHMDVGQVVGGDNVR